MNVLIIGGGGREHAFAWKVAQSPLVENLFIAPGNAGTAEHGTNLDLDPMQFSAVVDTINTHAIELLIVGPEAPLVEGLIDYVAKELPDLCTIGPQASGAQLEGSKAFSKAFMERHGIPTAAYREFTQDTLEAGMAYIRQHPLPIVLKADGLAAGKGVLICEDTQQALTEFEAMLDGKFGTASEKVVVEAFLSGIEFSVFVLTDGDAYRILPVAKDYKRIGEGDTGLNTGGMGSVSPVPFVDDKLMRRVEEEIIKPTIQGIRKDGLSYRGFIFFGLINVDGSPMVIEYNCRMGDPETQSVLPRIKNDLVDLCLATCHGALGDRQIEVDSRSVASVVLVSGGYPGSYEKGKKIKGLEPHAGGVIFHAGTRNQDGAVLTNGGRVLAVSSFGNNFSEALVLSNHKARQIDFEGKYYRSDIGFDL